MLASPPCWDLPSIRASRPHPARPSRGLSSNEDPWHLVDWDMGGRLCQYRSRGSLVPLFQAPGRGETGPARFRGHSAKVRTTGPCSESYVTRDRMASVKDRVTNILGIRTGDLRYSHTASVSLSITPVVFLLLPAVAGRSQTNYFVNSLRLDLRIHVRGRGKVRRLHHVATVARNGVHGIFHLSWL